MRTLGLAALGLAALGLAALGCPRGPRVLSRPQGAFELGFSRADPSLARDILGGRAFMGGAIWRVRLLS